jgi:hypothetical protein
MSLLAPVYTCTECKKVLYTLDELLFVEENSIKGFCSEECIEFFYSSLLKYYDQSIFELRTDLGIQDESLFFNISEQELVEEVIRSPSEIWRNQNELHEEIFSYIRHFPEGSVVLLCTVLKSEPSFIFHVTKTSSKKLLEKLRIGEKLAIPDVLDNDEIILDLESKKSVLLADLLSKRAEDDIPFEEFSHFDYCLEETSQTPDESFEFKDKEGDLLTIFIKSFSRNQKNFFYIIITFQNLNIISFPTQDLKLYSEFRMGKPLTRSLEN